MVRGMGFSVLNVREIKREPKTERGGKERALLLAPFFAPSSTLVPRSLLQNRTETLATPYF